MATPIEYKVVEESVVTDDALTNILNRYTREGWTFDGFQFAMGEGSHRPAMAFAIFRRPLKENEG